MSLFLAKLAVAALVIIAAYAIVEMLFWIDRKERSAELASLEEKRAILREIQKAEERNFYGND